MALLVGCPSEVVLTEAPDGGALEEAGFQAAETSPDPGPAPLEDIAVAEEDVDQPVSAEVMADAPEQDDVPEVGEVAGPAGPILRVEPNFIDFESVPPAFPKSSPLTVFNVGDQPLEIYSMSVAGDPHFSLIATPGENVTAGDSVTFNPVLVLEPSAAETFLVSYLHPDKWEPASASITIATNEASTTTVEMIANIDKCLDGFPKPANFGATALGQSKELTVLLDTCGSGPVQVVNIEMTKGADQFELLKESLPDGVLPQPTAPLIVPNSGMELAFRFTPAMLSEKPVDGELTFTFSPPGTYVFPLKGQGVPDICPVAVAKAEQKTVAAGTTIYLSSADSSAGVGTLVRWEWTVKTPEKSVAWFDGAYAESPYPEFVPDVPGKYDFSLSVWNDADIKSCIAGKVTVVAVP